MSNSFDNTKYKENEELFIKGNARCCLLITINFEEVPTPRLDGFRLRAITELELDKDGNNINFRTELQMSKEMDSYQEVQECHGYFSLEDYINKESNVDIGYGISLHDLYIVMPVIEHELSENTFVYAANATWVDSIDIMKDLMDGIIFNASQTEQ